MLLPTHSLEPFQSTLRLLTGLFSHKINKMTQMSNCTQRRLPVFHALPSLSMVIQSSMTLLSNHLDQLCLPGGADLSLTISMDSLILELGQQRNLLPHSLSGIT